MVKKTMSMLIACERTAQHAALAVAPRCLSCTRAFHPATCIVAVSIISEVIGFICPKCLAPDARARFKDACRVAAQQVADAR